MASQALDEHNYDGQRRQDANAKGDKWEQVAESDTDPIPRKYKYVVCSAAGTAVMKDRAGTSLTLTCAANEVLPVIPTMLLTASTGTFYGIIE